MADYTKEFCDAWTLYGSPKSSSKSLAFRNWLRLGKDRPSQELILAEISCYNRWLAEESSKNGREYPKCHMATWLAQRRYEGFEDDAQAMIAAGKHQDGHSMADASATAQSWVGGPGESLTNAFIALKGRGGTAMEVGYHAIIQKWFWPTVFSYAVCEGGWGSPVKTPVTILCPNQFHRDELEKRFGEVIRKAFGPDVQLTVAAKKIPPGV